MKKITSKGCISVLPEVTVKKRNRSKRVQLMISNKRVDWGYKQSVLSAQSRINLQMEKNDQKVLLVTSTLPQEGKSIFSVNLALAEIQNGKKTVLIDGDLRNPSVGRIFGFDGKAKGLSDFFDGRVGAEEIIVNSGNLSVISAGTRNVKCPKNFHFGLSASKTLNAFFFVFRPIATSVVRSTKPKVSTSTR